MRTPHDSSVNDLRREAMRFGRRRFLERCGAGAGLIGLAGLLGDEGLLAASAPDPLRPASPGRAARARSLIWIFVNGGPSQVDTFDHKPALETFDGTRLEGFDPQTGFFAGQVGPLMKSPFRFERHGQCGKQVSEIFPHLSRHVDRMAFIHSGFSESNNHSPALFMMNTGTPRMGSPCVGSWLTYGLGSESRDLPAFIVMSDPLERGLPKGHAANWSSGFLPSVYQGTHLRPKGDPIPNLDRPPELSARGQRAQFDLIAELERTRLAATPGDADLAARIESFELAYRMQTAAPESFDVESEPASIRALYGLDEQRCAHFARQCIVARRLVERGVRVVQIYSGGMENQRSWDGHQDIRGNHSGFAGETDQPIAALLTDLEQRGLLDETLIVWAGEFGRLPISQPSATPGRDHNPHAFTAWLAGGGVRGGVTYGESDEFGFRAVVDRVAIRDFHGTILHLLGIDHRKLTFRHQGLDQRLTTVIEEARIIEEILA